MLCRADGLFVIADFATGAGAQRLKRDELHILAEEPDRAVDEGKIGTPRVTTTKGGHSQIDIHIASSGLRRRVVDGYPRAGEHVRRAVATSSPSPGTPPLKRVAAESAVIVQPPVKDWVQVISLSKENRLTGAVLDFGDLVLLMAQASFADVVAGDDLDGGATNGGFTPATRVLVPDNTANNAQWPNGNERDYFGIGSIDIDGDGSCTTNPTSGVGGGCDLNPTIIDHSVTGVPGDRSGIIVETALDNKFMIADLEGSHNATSPNATGTWTFDISGHQNLTIGIDMAHTGDFGEEDRGGGVIVNDRFTWSYSIDGGSTQTLFNLEPISDGAGYVVNMADGNSYLSGEANFFYDQSNWDALGCIPGTADSCSADDVDVFGDGSVIVRTDPLDVNNDGYIYEDVPNSLITDTPTNAMNVEEDHIKIYETDNFFGTFSEAERILYKNALFISGAQEGSVALNNQLTQYVGAVSGTGDTLTLTLDAEQYGGARFLVFDNIVIESAAVDGDFNGDGNWDCEDINALGAAIAAGSTDLSFDMNGDGVLTPADITDAGSGWLAVGGANNPAATGGNPFLNADSNLDGTVDGPDFVAWNANKFGAGPVNWCGGDWNADGLTDGPDFLIWNNNKFMSSDHAASAVPEPCGLLLLLAAAWLPLQLRRRIA